MFEINKKKYLSLISITVFICSYLLFVELVLPVSEIIPKPSLIFESMISLFKDYGIVQSLALTSSVVYINLFLGYLLIHLFGALILKLNDNIGFIAVFSFLKLFKYFPFFAGIILFVFFYNTSINGEFIFSFLFVIVSLLNNFSCYDKDYVNKYKNFINNNKISSNKFYKVKYKLVQPGLYNLFNKLHLTLWAAVIMYEFIALTGGLGTKYYLLLSNHDFSGFVSLAILIGFLIWIGNSISVVIKNKIIFWEQ
ncbi:MAG: hypothetical protein V1773_03915 [bacterium]